MAPHATSTTEGSRSIAPAPGSTTDKMDKMTDGVSNTTTNTTATEPSGQSHVLDNLPTELPQVTLAPDTDAAAIGAAFASRLHQHGLERSVLQPTAIWRDVFALSGATHTYYGVDSLWRVWSACLAQRQAGAFEATPVETSVMRVPPAGSSWVEVVVRFTTAALPQTACQLVALLVPDGAAWRVWCMSTVLDGLVGQPSVHELSPGPRPPAPATTDYEAIVVGAGPAGLGIAGRLQALDVRYVVLDAHAAVGDNWRQRYDCMKLHTVREYAHLPFERTFGPEYSEWLGKHDLADAYQGWVQRYGIHVQMGSRVRRGEWDGARYTLHVDGAGGAQTLTAANVILAVGACSQGAHIPDIPGRELFRGETLHSLAYTTAPASWAGKRGVVVGTANTGHDLANDMADAGMAVTMIQRSPTWVIPRAWYQAGSGRNYNAATPTATADRRRFALPLGVSSRMTNAAIHARARAEPELYDAVEARGLRVQRFGDIGAHLYERGGGHYLDTGSCARIIKGDIGVRDGAAGVRFTPAGLAFADGAALDADVVVFATGFRGGVLDEVRRLFGEGVAARLDGFWGLAPDGEVRGAWRPQAQPGLWLAGGELGSARWYSSLVALQVKARVLGTPLPVLGRDFAHDVVVEPAAK